MVRSAGAIPDNPIDIVKQYGKHYIHGPEGQYDHLFFFSKYKDICDKLKIFGGEVYRQNGGWCWVCGKTKELLVIAKLVESQVNLTEDMTSFLERMKPKMS